MSFSLTGPANQAVAATVGYDAGSKTSTLTPTAELAGSTTYTATVDGAKDIAGNPMAGPSTWTFTTGATPPPLTEGPGGPILVITSSTNPFSSFYAEILRNEGYNEFATADISTISAATLASYDTAILGEMALTTAQVQTLSTWVTAGGNLVAMRPDQKLASLLGLSATGTTLADSYLQVDTTSGPGVGITGQTMQFHGTADGYSLSGASAVATLYSDATTPTADPAVTLRTVGTSGGQAAAFAYDLARSVVYTRQGNPAWAGQDRDGIAPIRTNDLFMGDGQPDWVDLNKVAIPQADEQQRLLGNLITQLTIDRKPLPHFWYLPAGKKAVVVLTGDDHANGGTVGRFDHLIAQSPPGCVVDAWECVRMSSYIFPGTPITDQQAKALRGAGLRDRDAFLGLRRGGVRGLHARHIGDGLRPPRSGRGRAAAEHRARYLDPHPLRGLERLGDRAQGRARARRPPRHGLLLLAGPMGAGPTRSLHRFWLAHALRRHRRNHDRRVPGGNPVERRSQPELARHHQHAARQCARPARLLRRCHGQRPHRLLLLAALRRRCRFGAGARGVSVVSGEQMQTWLDGRNASSFQSITWNGSHLGFDVAVGVGSEGLQALLPATSNGRPLTGITRNGSSVSFTTETVKGISYARFATAPGHYIASYAASTTSPVITQLASQPTANTAAISWTTDEAATSRVDYGTTTGALTQSVTNATPGTSHSLTLTGLLPHTTYYYRVTSADADGNSATFPVLTDPPASFTTSFATVTDTTSADFTAGQVQGGAYVSQTADGEVTLAPAGGSEFSGTALPSGWSSTTLQTGGTAKVSGGSLAVDGAYARTNATFSRPRSEEFVATFSDTANQSVGLGVTLNESPWAMFSTQAGGQLWASSRLNGNQIDTALGAGFLGAAHRFRIDWNAANIVYSVDDTVVATHTISIAASMRAVVRDQTAGGSALTVDWLRVTPYAKSGTFTSRVFDGSAAVLWSSASWTADVPSATSVTVRVRTRKSSNVSWSAYTVVASPGGAINVRARYIQYQVLLATTNTGLTPALRDLTIQYGA